MWPRRPSDPGFVVGCRKSSGISSSLPGATSAACWPCRGVVVVMASGSLDGPSVEFSSNNATENDTGPSPATPTGCSAMRVAPSCFLSNSPTRCRKLASDPHSLSRMAEPKLDWIKGVQHHLQDGLDTIRIDRHGCIILKIFNRSQLRVKPYHLPISTFPRRLLRVRQLLLWGASVNWWWSRRAECSPPTPRRWEHDWLLKMHSTNS